MNLESNDYYTGESMGDRNTTARTLRPYSRRSAAVLQSMLQRSATNRPAAANVCFDTPPSECISSVLISLLAP